jgi:PAS domain S-box-containing protein
MLDTEKTKEQLIAELKAARCRIAEVETVTNTTRDSPSHCSSSHYQSLVRLYELEINTLQELFDFALEEALILTKSPIGFVCFYNEATKIFTLYSWSKSVMNECEVVEKPNSFYLDSTGVWGEVVRQRKAIVINDFSSPNPLKKGWPDGHVVIRNFLSIPVWGANGIIAIIAVGNKQTDYTEIDIQQLDLFAKGVWVIAHRKEAEESLRLSEERYRSVVEDQTEVISRFAPDGTFLFVNEVYCRFFGKSANEFIGSKWFPVAVSDDILMIEATLDSLSPDNPVVAIENRVYNANNEVRWMQFINRAFFNETGALVEIQSVGRDITDRKQAEEEIRESKQRLNFVLEGCGYGIWDWNIETNKVIFSSQCSTMLGYDGMNEDVIAWESLIHPDDIDNCQIEIQRFLKGEISVFIKEYRVLCRDGLYIWILSRGKVLQRDAEGKPLRAIGTLVDITERKRVEALKEEVDKIMRHDLRSPLLGIVGLPDILLENESLNTREREILLMIQDSGYKILSMVNNSLDIYKMEVGSYRLNSMEVDIIPLFAKAISGLIRQSKHKDIGFLITVDQHKPSSKDVFIVETEEILFCNMISNLLLNAIEASPSKQAIVIELSTSLNLFKIVNKGSVPIEIREKFFEKYVTAGKTNGTGLGTYSAALIATTHGWKINLDTSIPGQTTVTVEF